MYEGLTEEEEEEGWECIGFADADKDGEATDEDEEKFDGSN